MRKYRRYRVMSTPLVVERVDLINRVIHEHLNESFDRVIPTEYTEHRENTIKICRFKTDSGNSYDLEFIQRYVGCNVILSDGELGDYTDKIEIHDNPCFIPTVDIAFVPSEINISDRDNHELYTKETDRGEHFELMGRVSYIIKKYVDENTQVKTYVIGKNTKESKLKMYIKLFENIFSGDFTKHEGENPNYDEGGYYFIKRG